MKDQWSTYAKSTLKKAIKSSGLTTSELAMLLNKNGACETKASVDNKISRGTFSASFFFQCLFFLNNKECSKIPTFKDASEFIKLPANRGDQFYSKKELTGYIHPRNANSKKLKRNKVISLFTGAGGLDIGLELAGYDTSACVEIDEHCRETLKHNRPEWGVFEDSTERNAGDIRKINPEELLKTARIKKGEAALVVGGAPCQPFSNMGKKLGKDDPRNGDLFLEFVRMVKGIEPQAFIFENVVGITQAKHSDVIHYMKEKFAEVGYTIAHTVLNSADYGVPQKRQRFFILGLKGEKAPLLPMPTHSKNFKEWSNFVDGLDHFPDYIPKDWVTVGDAFEKLPQSKDTRTDNKKMNISDIVKERMKLIGPGENFKVLPMDMRPNCWKDGGKHQGQDTFGRLRLDEPSVTIRTAAYNPSKGRYIHPTENRGLDIVEMASLQSFPYEWEFKCAGNKSITLKSGGAQVGNAVPPLLAKAIGEALYAQLSHLE
jgi:DNA (cytosine-5)-methyltransferase 1